MDKLKRVKSIQRLKKMYYEVSALRHGDANLSRYEKKLLNLEMAEIMGVINRYDKDFKRQQLGNDGVMVIGAFSLIRKMFTGEDFYEAMERKSKYKVEEEEAEIPKRVTRKDYEGTSQEIDFEARAEARDEIYKKLLNQ